MVYAELIHNPYLLKTDVIFNGQSPKINSQIEKHEHTMLKDWIDLVPEIFYDEMNGYDFDFNFTGTVPDFEEVKLAFQKAGVSQEQVRLFLKNELEDVDTKSREINLLVDWLRSHVNRRFDWERFWEENRELLEGKYTYIVIRGTVPESMPPQISVESVGSADELQGTLLTNTPILFTVDEESMAQFRKDLVSILARKDVCQKQLFFLFRSVYNQEQTARVISDLGVIAPQIVTKTDDERIIHYLQNYPITEYIREVIRVMEKEVQKISQILEAESRQSELKNADIHARIERLEHDLSELKQADNHFAERDNFNTPPKFAEQLDILEERIRKWRNRKTKVTGDHEAEIAAGEYDCELKKYMNSFLDAMQKESENICSEIMENARKIYEMPGMDCEYTPADISCESPCAPMIPSLAEELVEMKEITYEESKNDLLNLFLKTSAKEEKKPVRVVTCYYEKWRNKAVSVFIPAARLYLQEYTDLLREYYDQLSEKFHLHLTELIQKTSEEKEKVSARLSDDDRKLQEDHDWLNTVKDQLFQIERG